MKFFQVLSRNNDVNGNPFRLILVYDANGNMDHVAEARSSSPNYREELQRQGLAELYSVHLSPGEYNDTKKRFKTLLKHVD